MAVEIKDPKALEAALNGLEGGLADLSEKYRGVENIGDEVGTLKEGFKELSDIVKAQGRRVGFSDGKAPINCPVTKEQFVKEGMKAFHEVETKVVRKRSFSWESPAPEDVSANFQEKCDNLYILSIAKFGSYPSPEQTRSLQYYKTDYAPAREKAAGILKEAMSTGDANLGGDWIPTQFSTRLIEKIRLEMLIAGLFEHFRMPRDPFVFPAWLNDVDAFTFAENTDVTGTAIGDALQNDPTVTSNIQWDAVGMGARAYTSKFQEEDSIIAILPFLQRAIAMALRNAAETAILNGDDSSPHQDNDIEALTLHPAKAWKGLRFAALASTAQKDAGGVKIQTDATWRDFVQGTVGLQGKYGVVRPNLALITSPQGVNQLSAIPNFRTLDVFGSNATNVDAGPQGFRPDGMQLVVSEFQKENLAATGVNTAGGPNNTTSYVIVNKNAWMVGDLRNVTIQILREVAAERDQDVVLATMRWSFNSAFGNDGSDTHTGVVFDIGL